MPEFLILASALVAWTVLEGYYIVTGRPTISDNIRDAARRWPPLGFIVGIVAGLFLGHLFFQ